MVIGASGQALGRDAHHRQGHEVEDERQAEAEAGFGPQVRDGRGVR